MRIKKKRSLESQRSTVHRYTVFLYFIHWRALFGSGGLLTDSSIYQSRIPMRETAQLRAMEDALAMKLRLKHEDRVVKVEILNVNLLETVEAVQYAETEDEKRAREEKERKKAESPELPDPFRAAQ